MIGIAERRTYLAAFSLASRGLTDDAVLIRLERLNKRNEYGFTKPELEQVLHEAKKDLRCAELIWPRTDKERLR